VVYFLAIDHVFLSFLCDQIILFSGLLALIEDNPFYSLSSADWKIWEDNITFYAIINHKETLGFSELFPYFSKFLNGDALVNYVFK
jgi:hypothetical protein